MFSRLPAPIFLPFPCASAKLLPIVRSSNSLKCGVASVFTPRQIIAETLEKFRQRKDRFKGSCLNVENAKDVASNSSENSISYYYFNSPSFDFNKLNVSSAFYLNPPIIPF